MLIDGSIDFMGTFTHFRSGSSRRVGGEKGVFPPGSRLTATVFPILSRRPLLDQLETHFAADGRGRLLER